MLSEKEQTSFLNISKPPYGYELTYCIGTTFSLDIECLVQMAVNSRSSNSNVLLSSTPEILEIITRFEAKTLVFCQNCRIKEIKSEDQPGLNKDILNFYNLVDSTVEVVPPPNERSSFHPKVWFLRFDADSLNASPVFRLVTMSRNLTMDLKWDISVTLVGELAKEPIGVGINGNIIGFLNDVASSSSLIKSSRKNKIIKKAIRDLEYVQFEGPINKNCDFDFIYQNPGEQKTSFKTFSPKKFEDLIVISPFLNSTVLKRLDEPCQRFYLITGEQDLAQLKKIKHRLGTSFTMQSENMGLHAKIYIGREKGSGYTDIYVGSANCTRRGLDGENFEAMMYMQAPKNYFDRFVECYIYENYSDKVPNPWLRLIDEEDVEREIVETEKELITKELENLRDKIATGMFKVAFDSVKKNVAITYHNEQRIYVPPSVGCSFQMFGHGNRSDFNLLLSGKPVILNASLQEVSTFVSLVLKKNNVTLSFWTVAKGTFDRSIRRKLLTRSVVKDWGAFLKYLRSILDMPSPPVPIKWTVENGNGVSGGVKKKVDKLFRILDMEHILELLLINVGANLEQIERIDDVLSGLDANSIKGHEIEHAGFLKIWKEYKAACQIFGRGL